jgi:hypothetical protein
MATTEEQVTEKLNADGSSTDGCLPSLLALLGSALLLIEGILHYA